MEALGDVCAQAESPGQIKLTADASQQPQRKEVKAPEKKPAFLLPMPQASLLPAFCPPAVRVTLGSHISHHAANAAVCQPMHVCSMGSPCSDIICEQLADGFHPAAQVPAPAQPRSRPNSRPTSAETKAATKAAQLQQASGRAWSALTFLGLLYIGARTTLPPSQTVKRPQMKATRPLSPSWACST